MRKYTNDGSQGEQSNSEGNDLDSPSAAPEMLRAARRYRSTLAVLQEHFMDSRALQVLLVGWTRRITPSISNVVVWISTQIGTIVAKMNVDGVVRHDERASSNNNKVRLVNTKKSKLGQSRSSRWWSINSCEKTHAREVVKEVDSIKMGAPWLQPTELEAPSTYLQ